MENPLEQRIKDLEQQLDELRAVVAKLSSQKDTIQNSVSAKKEAEKPFITPVLSKAKKIKQTKTQQDHTQSGEKWLGRLGIGLLLFGAIFLFKYSIDQGWITPIIRVLFGLGLGIILFLFGMRLYENNKMLSRLLLGGGIATYYITIFSAFQLYNLVSHTTAFIFMALVTLSAFLLALRQVEPLLSIIGIIGGLLTPFLLYTGENNIPGLVSYTSLLIIGASITYMMQGWRALLWLTSLGSWIVWGVAISSLPDSIVGYLTDKWSIQIGIIISWIVVWALPGYREFLCLKNPDKWQSPNLDLLKKRFSNQFADLVGRHIYMLTLSTPLIALVMVKILWNFSHETAGYINLIVSFVYLLLYVKYRKYKQLELLFFAHGLTAFLILSWAFILIFEGNTQFFVLAMESWVLYLIAYKVADLKLQKLSALFVGVMGIILVLRVFTYNALIPFVFNSRALIDLAFLLMLGHVAYIVQKKEQTLVYFALTHIALMGWLLRELHGFENGQALVTVGWAVLGLAVFIYGLKISKLEMRYIGSLTIFIVVGKLFIVDLAELETIWRIILFIGFGAALLIVSNYLRKLIGKKKESFKDDSEK